MGINHLLTSWDIQVLEIFVASYQFFFGWSHGLGPGTVGGGEMRFCGSCVCLEFRGLVKGLPQQQYTTSKTPNQQINKSTSKRCYRHPNPQPRCETPTPLHSTHFPKPPGFCRFGCAGNYSPVPSKTNPPRKILSGSRGREWFAAILWGSRRKINK